MKLTKRLLAMLLLVCMVFSMLPAIALTASAATIASSSKWTEVAWKDIEDGDTIIIGNTNNKALPSTTTSTNPTKTAITVSGTAGSLTITPGSGTLDSIAWDVDVQSGAGASSMIAKLYQHDSTSILLYLTGTSSNTALRVNNGTSNNTFTMGSGGKLLKVTTAARYVGEYVSGSDWRTYNSETGTNYSGQSLKFYRLNTSAPTPTHTVSSAVSPSGAGTVSLGASSVAEGSTTTATATPGANYTFTGWTISGTGASLSSTTANPTTITMGTANVTVTANFAAKQKYTVTYSVNGDTSVVPAKNDYAGTSYTLPTASDIAGYTFAGWVESAIGTETTTAPTVLTDSYTMPAANTTLYAVYTRTEGVSGGSTPQTFAQFMSDSTKTSGEFVIAANVGGTYKAMSNTFASKIDGTTITVTDGAVASANAGSYKVTIEKNGSSYTISNGSSYLTYSSSTNLGTSSSKYNWSIASGVKGTYRFNSTTSGRGLIYRAGSTNQFGGYSTSNVTAGGTEYYDVEVLPIGGGSSGTTYYTTTVNTAATYYTLTYGVNPASSGTIACDVNSNTQVEEGTDVTLTATAAEHFTFSGWTVNGASAGSNATLNITMDADKTVVANFTAEPTYTVTVTPAAGGTMTASKLTGIYAGETITLTATPDAHYSFNGWQCTAGGATISGNTFTMPAANVTVTGSFTEATKYTVTFYASSLPADTGSALSTQSVYGGEYATAPTPGSKDGFTFLGWYTTAGTWSTNPGVIKSSTVDSTAVNANVTYYGVWAEGDNVGGTFKLHLGDYYVGGRTGTNKYLDRVSSEADAAEFGVDDGGYLYFMDGSTKYYISSTASGADLSFTTNISSATPWTVTENNGTISFETTASSGRELAYNASASRFAAYAGSATYPYEFDKIGGTAVSEYTTAPVQTASHTVYWHNGDTYTTTSVKEGTAITAPEEAPTKDDYQETYYTFAGWSVTEGGAVASSYGNMGTSDMHFYAVFTPATYSFTAAISGADSVKVDRSKVLTASLTADPSKDTGDYTVSWTTSDASKVSVDANGRITGHAEGSAVITATYTLLDGTTVTATKTITVLPAAAAGSGYTLITQDNVPEDWTGDYIIMGKIGGDTTYMNDWMLLTPNYDGGSVVIASNNEDAATITIEDDGSGIGTGTINDEGNASSGVDKSIVMEDTGLVTDTNGDDSILVYDTITEIDDGYAFTIECIDDINQIYTIRVKDTNLYLSCSANTSTGSNTLAFDSAATERAQWQFSVQRVTKGGYNNDIIVAQNIGNSTRRLYFNSNTYGGTNGQFRDYHSGAYGSMIGGNATGGGQTYNLYLFGNPNPFKAQIYYHGEQITLVETGKVNANAQTAHLTGALTPDIDNYPNWTQVGNPAWEIVENSTGNHMTINSATGLITTNASTVGSYALVKITYTVHDVVNNVDKLVSTTSKVEVIAADTTYSTVIYELYSGEDTEVQYTVPNSMTELPLAAYVVNDTTDDNSKTGNVVMGGTLNWSITSTSPSTSGTFSIDANGVLHMYNVTKDYIVTVKVTGATGDNMAATAATYKIYVKTADYTLTVVPTTDSQGTYDADNDVLTVAGSENSAHLTYNVVDDQNRGPGADTFTLAGYAWTISGDAQGALINSNGLLDFSGMDRSEDHTITAVVSRVAATDAATGTMKSGLTDTITIVVKAQTIDETLDAIDDTVIIDWALPVTFNVLTNDDYNVEVTVNAVNLPAGVVSNGNGSFTYTPSGWQTADQTFTYTLSGTVNGASAADTATVTLKTADSIYYEDTYSNIFTFTGNWSDVTDGTLVAEQTSSLDTADIFEFDANHEAYAKYSGGTAKMTTLSKGANASVSFTFAGTGFDVISATNNNAGAFMLTVKDSNGAVVTDPATGLKLSKIMDIFRGYTYTAEAYTRYGLYKVNRYIFNGQKYVIDAAGNFYYDRDTESFVENDTWYNGEPGKYYDDVNQFDEMVDEEGSYIVKEFTSNWLPYDISKSEAENYNNNYYQIPIIKVTDLPYGTYTVTLKPTYSAAYDRAGDGSYDFYFDGVRIHNPVADRAAEYKYISIHDAVKAGEGFGSGEVVACDHQGHAWSDWTFYSRARNTTSATTTNRGSFVQYCSFCGGVANTAYFHVAITADNTELGVGGYNSLPSTTMLRYTLTADACENQAAIQAKLDAMRGSLTEYWSSNSRGVMTCMNNSNVVIGNGNGTTYATLQLKDPATQTIYASAIHSPTITVYADETHEHTFGDWTHDADSDPSTHTHTCTGENCSFYETEECVFTSAVTTQPTQTETGIKTYTCSACGYSYEEVIPALGGHTATFHVPEGAAAPAAQTGNSVTMPAAVAAPADYDAHSYTFVGWVESTVSDTTTEQTVYEAGASIDLSADTDFYALYTYGGNAGGYTLSSTAPQAGDSVIIAAEKDGTYYALPQDSFTGEELTVSGNTATNVDGLTWTAYDASYSGSTGIGFNNGTNPLHMNSSALKVASGDQNGTFEFTASGDGFIVESNQNDRWLKYNGSSFGVANVASGATPIVFFISSGATYYTTDLAATCKHLNTTTTTVDATCTAAGSTTVTCDDCGEVISVTPITALGHYYVPTPAAGGTTYTCSRCGDSYFEADEFEVTYVLQPGVTVSGNSREGNAITLPTSVSIPATYNAQTYTFVGWANATSADGTTNPTVYAKGEVVNINADTTFYPVYKFGTAGGTGTWTLLENASNLSAGMTVVFASNTKGLTAGNISNSVMGVVDSTFSSDKKTITSLGSDTVQMTVGGSSGAWTFSNGDALLGATAVKKVAWGSGTTTWSVSISNGDATILNTTSSYGRFLHNVTSPRFTTYATSTAASTSMLLPQIYYQAGGASTLTYTFELKAASDSYAATLTPATLNMTTGSSASLTATLTNNGAVVTAEDVEFSSSNDSIVLVDEDTGYLVAGSTAGTATITVQMLAADGVIYTATATINVVEQSDNVTVNYIGSRTGNVKNWGTRGTTATFLTTPADEYYTGSYSYETLSALSGDSGSGTDFYSSALGTAIHNMLTAKQTSTTSYAGTTSLYAYTDCIESGNKISSFYSAGLVGPNWDSGSTWNREHTWPNSKGLDGADENDIMMLRPTAVSENSSRGNTAYGEGTGYYDPNKHGQNLHGDVARLMLQHLMRWGNTSKFYGTGGVIESRAILLKWLAEDPVDTWELGRNDAVQRITGVRNVFVDYPELAFKLLGADVPANYTTPSKSGIVAAATYSASAGSGYEPVTGANSTRNVAKRDIPTGNFGGAVIIDGKGTANTFDDFAAYGPNNEVYLAPGQGIVFSLTSDKDITTQDLQIGAKAVNGTATQMDVASISNGTVSTGIKYLLENKTIASATEMYYELDGSQVGWSNGESSVIVIYNSGSGVLSLTNLRYSTANNNTLTMNINDVETQPNGSNDDSKGISRMRMAMEMLRIVYGTAVTLGDPNVTETVVTPSDITPSDIPTESSEPIESGDPTEPTGDPTEPTGDPTEPSSDPTEPTEPTNPVNVDTFKDLDKTAWYMDGVKYAIDNGLMNGVSDTEFAPNGTLTRAMLVTILYRLAGQPKDAAATIAFTDVTANDWYYEAVVWAVKAGVANGTSATTFDPNAPVTREQLVTFLWRYVGEPESKQSLDSFPDGANVSEYARAAMQWAVENGIINGKEGGKLDPQGNATRAEIAVIFMRAEKTLARPE